jgi:hypothetical protein
MARVDSRRARGSSQALAAERGASVGAREALVKALNTMYDQLAGSRP